MSQTPLHLPSLLTPFLPLPRAIAVAVSGGADSMALLLLLKEYTTANGITLTALTVDHQLRLGSAAEASQVAAWCTTLGIPHTTLAWEGEKPQSNIHAQAREARYVLMTDWCTAHNVANLFVAHHQDDQAETFLIRLGRGSGVRGLSGMSATTHYHGVRLCRPLLPLPAAALKEILTNAGQEWIEDPSNTDEKYTRTKMRQLLRELPSYGITPERVVLAADNLRRADTALNFYTTAHLAKCVIWESDPAGDNAATLLLSLFLDAPEEIVLRSLRAVLQQISGNQIPPRLKSLLRLYTALQGNFTGATLHGCVLQQQKKGVMVRAEG